MTEYAIQAEHLSKKFKLANERRMALKERFVRGKAPKAEEFWALKDASFDVPKGSMFGIIGHNGSGKSTALKVLAGIYRPTSGSVVVNGRMSALLELGAGFHPELTGRENIALNASILGMSRKRNEASVDEIVDFAGLGRFIDSPIKVYSSGMYVRLGFAVAVKVDPEVLVIDEVIAVGDEDFQRKCFDYIHKLRSRGSTVVIVTHSLGIVTEKCDSAMWLEHGEVQALGAAREVVDGYMQRINEAEAIRDGREIQEEDNALHFRRGTGELQVTAIGLLGPEGDPVRFLLAGQPGTIRMYYDAKQEVRDAVFGLGFFNDSGVNVAGPNTGRIGRLTIERGAGYVDFHMPQVLLANGTYKVTTAVLSKGNFVDSLDRVFEFKVRSATTDEPGLVILPGGWDPPVTGSAASVDANDMVFAAPDTEHVDEPEPVPTGGPIAEKNDTA